jgi:hypothetical protein
MAKSRNITAAEHAKVRRALDLLQEAQSIVEDACQELCPIPGFSDTWGRTCKLYDAVKAHWHLVEARRQGSTPPPERKPVTRIPPEAHPVDLGRIEVEIPIEWEREVATP